MLDINFIRENTDEVKKKVASKNFDTKLIDEVLKLDEKRRKLISEIDDLRAKRNEAAKAKDIEKGRKTKEELQEKEPELKKVEEEYKEILYQVPNLPSKDTPIGKDDSENKIIRKWGKPKKFDFEPLDHVALGEKLGIINIEKAGKVSGTRFSYLMRDAALLEFALIQLAFETLVKKGFVPVVPPQMIKPDVYTRMARLGPDTKNERYYLQNDDMYLIGSAEHTLGPLHMDETLNEKDLPIRYVGFSTSFRREAGSYGKDTRGILRVHQFDKVEMETFTAPKDAEKEQEFLVSIQEELMKKLNLPYQVVAVCTGDMGGPDYKQIDIETWIPSQKKYRETHSADYMTDYQSRRLNTRVKTKNGLELVHMNDATVFAIGRTIIAIIENYQNNDGSVGIPKVLQKWMGKDKITSQV